MGLAGGSGGAPTEPACSTGRSRDTWLGLARGCWRDVPCFRARSFSVGGWARGRPPPASTWPCPISFHDSRTQAAVRLPMACLALPPPRRAPGSAGLGCRKPGFLVRRRYSLGIQRRKGRSPEGERDRRKPHPVCGGSILQGIRGGAPGHGVLRDGRGGARRGHRPFMAAPWLDPTGPEEPSEEAWGRPLRCSRACPSPRRLGRSGRGGMPGPVLWHTRGVRMGMTRGSPRPGPTRRLRGKAPRLGTPSDARSRPPRRVDGATGRRFASCATHRGSGAHGLGRLDWQRPCSLALNPPRRGPRHGRPCP